MCLVFLTSPTAVQLCSIKPLSVVLKFVPKHLPFIFFIFHSLTPSRVSRTRNADFLKRKRLKRPFSPCRTDRPLTLPHTSGEGEITIQKRSRLHPPVASEAPPHENTECQQPFWRTPLLFKITSVALIVLCYASK